MNDLHTHLLYGIDDGAGSLEESIKLLKEMEKSGITECILTPHYINKTKYNCNNYDKQKLFETLQTEIDNNNINIKIYLGNEVFITSHFIELLEKDEIRTLNNSKYLLFEFPMKQRSHNTTNLINELVSKGYMPILAHPERYEFLQKNPDIVQEYLRCGLLLQGNFTSLFRKYDRKSEKTLKYYLKKKWISFLGSDTHHDVNFNSEKLRKKLLRITKDEKYVADLMENNFNKVINNEEIGMIR